MLCIVALYMFNVTIASADVTHTVTRQTAKRKDGKEYALQELQVRFAEADAEEETRAVRSYNVRALEPGTWTEVRETVSADDSDDDDDDTGNVYDRFTYVSDED